jgi:hypothetical protein
MFEFPKLIVLILVFAAIWIGYRWLNGPAREFPRRRTPQPRRAIPVEDLVACGACGAYVAAHAPACGRPDCPQPR